MKKTILSVMLLFISLKCFGDVTFDISILFDDGTSGIAPLEITIVDYSSATGETIQDIQYNWGDGSGWTTDLTHIYEKRGVFNFTSKITTDVGVYEKTYPEFANTNIYLVSTDNDRYVSSVCVRDGATINESPFVFGTRNGYLYSIDYAPHLSDIGTYPINSGRIGGEVIGNLFTTSTEHFLTAVRDLEDDSQYHVYSMHYDDLSNHIQAIDFDERIVSFQAPDFLDSFLVATESGAIYGYAYMDGLGQTFVKFIDNLVGGVPTGSGFVNSCALIPFTDVPGENGFVYKQCGNPVNSIEKYSFDVSPPTITLLDSVKAPYNVNFTTMTAIIGVDFNHSYILVGTDDGSVVRYDRNLNYIDTKKIHSSRITCFETKIFQSLVVSGSSDKSVKVWYGTEVSGHSYGEIVKSYYRMSGEVSSVSLGRSSIEDRSYLTIGTSNGVVHVKTCAEIPNTGSAPSTSPTYDITYSIEGSSSGWGYSFSSLQEVMSRLKGKTDPAEIWITQGTITLPVNANGFGYEMKKKVSLYGDFEGNEIVRDPLKTYFPDNTIIEINKPGKVLKGADGTVLCGFKIRGGEALDFGSKGAGLCTDSAVMTVKECKFTDNESYGNGSDIYAFKGGLTVNKCNFTGSRKTCVAFDYGTHSITNSTFTLTADSEWAVYNTGSNCSIQTTTVQASGSPGGFGVYSKSDSMDIDRCSFFTIKVVAYNAPVSHMRIANSMINGCILNNSSPVNLGSLVYSGDRSYMTFVHNTVVGNDTSVSTDPNKTLFMFDSTDSLLFGNNILWGNNLYGGGKILTNMAASEGIDPLLRHHSVLLWTDAERFDFDNDFVYTKMKVNIGDKFQFVAQNGYPSGVTPLQDYWIVTTKPFKDGYAFQFSASQGGSVVNFSSGGGPYAPILLFDKPVMVFNNQCQEDATFISYPYIIPMSYVTDTLTSDPLFADVLFRLQAGSPCIDSALPGYASIDYFGTSRPQGAAPDRGLQEKP